MLSSPIGKLTLFMGPMFSGKSTLLIETLQKTSYNNKKPILIYHKNTLTHPKEHKLNFTYNTIQCSTLQGIITTLEQYDTIGIDEGHLFPDLVNVSEYLCRKGKYIYIAALSSDYKMEPFLNVSNLIAKADKIKLLKAYCFYCKKEAGFTLKNAINEKELLGNINKNIYKPVCKMCHFINNVNDIIV